MADTVTGTGRRFAVGPYLALLPFFAFLLFFLIVPTFTVVFGAFQSGDGGFTLGNLRALGTDAALNALWKSVLLSFTTALVGRAARRPALLPDPLAGRAEHRPARDHLGVRGAGAVRRGHARLRLHLAARHQRRADPRAGLLVGLDIYGSGWLFGLKGLIVVYVYFQIPLMVIVFTPALEGLRPQWREAAVNLGATTSQYWRQVGIPLLTPAFLGSALLLFANAFAAYATAAVLVSQGNPITPLFIRSALTSEILLGQANLGFALALEMIVVVSIVMGMYALLLRRTSRWMR